MRATLFYIATILPGSALGEDLIILGDNQTHQSRGSALIAQSGFPDKHITEVTRRPPGQALFGTSVLRAIIAKHKNTPILHLGDGLDISCTTEAQEFFTAISTARLIVVAPGNHDGYFLGNFHPAEDGPRAGKMTQTSWKLACEDRAYYGSPTAEVEAKLKGGSDWDGRLDFESEIPKPGRPFDRNAFIRRYLGFHGYSGNDLHGEFDAYDGQLKMNWSIDERDPWKSYLSQVLYFDSNGTKAAIVIVDTAQARKRPKLGWFLPVVAGTEGWISSDQAGELERMIENISNNVEVLFAGHHDFDTLNRKSKDKLGMLMRRSDAKVYLSGHSHRGWTKTHRFGGWKFTELNVGSVLDAPVEYRLAEIVVNQTEKLLAATQRPIELSWGKSEGTSFTDCKTDWRLPVESLASPESYAPTGSLGWFKASHRELDAQLTLMIHQWTVVPPQDPEPLCYMRDSEALADAFCASNASAVIEHTNSVIGQPKDKVASRQKARLFSALTRSYGELSDDAIRYQFCQAVDSAWRDLDRQTDKPSKITDDLVQMIPL